MAVPRRRPVRERTVPWSRYDDKRRRLEEQEIIPAMTQEEVRGCAVLDAQDRLRLLDVIDPATKVHVERVLYAAVDVLDERISIESITAPIAAASGTAGTAGTSGTAAAGTTDGDETSPGLYLGQLATQGRLAVYGYVTSVRKRVLVCIDWRSGEKISDLAVRDLLRELGRMYVEETAGNPFSGSGAGSERWSERPVAFRDRARLREICARL